MENEEIRQYLISFVEKTLNSCEAFTRVYGTDFVRDKLEVNLGKVYTDISTGNANTGLYDMESACITIYSTKTLTIADIENNKRLKHMILHESIHSIFRRTKEECQNYGIEDGTGILEFYNNSQELGRGFNEGLTEWICQKAGYGEEAYASEKNIINILELALGEDSVMQLTNGNIKENVAKILQMSKVECLQTIALIDNIYQREQRIKKINQSDLDYEDEELDKSISHLEVNLFEKYFRDEIETAQKQEYISEETMNRLFDLNFSIHGGKTQAAKVFETELPLKFKNEIYPELLRKQQKALLLQRKQGRNSKATTEKTNLPVVYKESWFRRIKEAIKSKFIHNSNQKDMCNNQPKATQKQQFKEQIKDMSNYSTELIQSVKTNQLEEQKSQEDTSELDL